MKKLIEGVQKFRQESFGPKQGLFERLSKGQSPEALFITCSDSRIDPNLLTRTEPGDLFVLRNAGNLVPPHGASQGGEAAAVEYAVAALGVKHIVVCGHSQCGAMKGLLHPESLTELPAVAAWLKHAEPTRAVVQARCGGLSDAELLAATVEANVMMQLANLRTLPSVAARLAQGDLKLHGWVYAFETGEVAAHDADAGGFVALDRCRDAQFVA